MREHQYEGKPVSAKMVAAFVLMGACLTSPGDAEAQILGTADTYGVLAGSTVTNTGSSVIEGNVGVSPGTAVIGFPPGIVVAPGTIHAADAHAGQAQVDLTNAYVTLMAMPTLFDLSGQDLGGMTLGPGVYGFTSSAQLTGLLTLNGFGDTASQFVFKIGSSLTTASGSAVLLINGANGNNVYWAVGSSATLGTNSVFAGNIVALSSITLTTGAQISCGRALARNGAVTLDTNTITLCAPGGDGGDISIEEVGGEGVSGTQETALGASRTFASTMLREAGFGGLAPQTYFYSLKDGTTPIAAYQPHLRRIWATGLGGTSALDSDAGELRFHSVGFAMGFDAQIDQSTFIGIAGGYTSSAFSVDEMQTSGTVDGAHVGLYGVRRLGPAYLAASAQYARFYNETDRFIDWVVDDRAAGKFDSTAWSARIETGLPWWFGNHRVTPFADMQVSHLTSNAFTEASASVLGLTFDANSVTSVQGSLGIQFDTRIILSNGRTLTPFARVAWVHEFNTDRGLDSSLTLSPAASFSLAGITPASDMARVGAGVKFDITESTGLFASVDGEFSGHSQSYGGTGGVKVTW